MRKAFGIPRNASLGFLSKELCRSFTKDSATRGRTGTRLSPCHDLVLPCLCFSPRLCLKTFSNSSIARESLIDAALTALPVPIEAGDFCFIHIPVSCGSRLRLLCSSSTASRSTRSKAIPCSPTRMGRRLGRISLSKMVLPIPQ